MADAAAQEGPEDRCPTCASPVERGQLICLNCGGRVGLRYRKPPRWPIPVVLASLVVLLAAAGVFVALQTAGDEAEEEVASGRASRQEAARQDRPAPTPTAPKTQPERQPAAPGPDPGLEEARDTPIAVLSGVPQPGAAAKFARRLERQRFGVKVVTNAPGPAERSAVLFAPGAERAARALARHARIPSVKPVDPATAGAANGVKLYVVVGGSGS